jgi:cation-transporting P-type ATPase I
VVARNKFASALAAALAPYLELLGQPPRASWIGTTHAAISIAPLSDREFTVFVRRLHEAAARLERVRSVDVDATQRRVAIGFEAHAYKLEDLERLVELAEVLAKYEVAPPGAEEPPEAEAERRLAVETVIDTVALLVGTGLELSLLRPSALGGVAATVITVTRSTTRLRKSVDNWLGPQRTELVMTVVGALGSAAAQRPLSSLVEVLHKGTLWRELSARRALWRQVLESVSQVEPSEQTEPMPVQPRPAPLPPGPIEQYADRAWIVSLGGFALSFLTTRSLHRSVAALFGALPKPATRGREAFAAQLALLLARHRMLVVEPEALRRLDRMDCLVVDQSLATRTEYDVVRMVVDPDQAEHSCRELAELLFDPDEPLEVRRQDGWSLGPLPLLAAEAGEKLALASAELGRQGALVIGLEHEGRIAAVLGLELIHRAGVDELIGEAHAAGLRVVVSSDDESILHRLPVDDTVPVGDALPAGVRRLQEEGRVVCLVAASESAALPVADCGIGLASPGQPMPWGAHIVCTEDLSSASLVLRACTAARQTSKQGVTISLGAATVGAIVAALGLWPLPTRRVVAVVNAATVMSMLNAMRHVRALARRPLPAPRDRTPWQALDARGVLRRLESSELGLSRSDAAARSRRDERPETRLTQLADAIGEELFNPLTPLLAAGAGLSAAAGSVMDAAMVGSVVVLNAAVGGIQRYRTERAIRGLARVARRRALVRRNGRPVYVDAAHLAVGDVVLLDAGDVVPADCRIVHAEALEVDASSLTGESLPVAKSERASFASTLADQSSMLHEGTSIAAGRATAVVVAVGAATEASRGATAVRRVSLQSGVERRMRQLIDMTAPLALLSGAGLVAAGWVRGRHTDQIIGSGVSLAVASVPEGLPLLATAAQLAAAKRLTRRGALVRNARAIEALGRVDVLCVDKTGTLTQGRIELRSVSDGRSSQNADALSADHRLVLACGLRATAREGDGAHVTDHIDRALLRAARRSTIATNLGAPGWEVVADLPFEPGRGYHAVVGHVEEGELLCVKGAPEVVLPRCTHPDSNGQPTPLEATALSRLYAAASDLAWRGLRVLAVAERRAGPGEPLDPAQLSGLAFRGFLAFSDPVRPTAGRAVSRLRDAGVHTVMITGDHPSTASAIAGELSLLEDRRVVSGSELDSMSDDELDASVGDVAVFARVTPSQKVRVVRALQRVGRVVAMVGDGANDAPAIRLANVGIAIGPQSTAAARAAADIVLVDEHIDTIVDAIVEGRAMWASVRDAVSILIGGNLGEIAFTLGAGLIDGYSPLSARQLLLVNLLTDVAPAMAVALRPPTPAVLASLANEGPDASLGEPLNRDITARAAVTAAGAGAAWAVSRLLGSHERASTVALLALVGTQLGQTLRAGELSRPVVATSVLSAATLGAIVQIPGLSHFFGCRPLGPLGWSTAALASIIATSASPSFPAVADRLARAVGQIGAPVAEAAKSLRPALEAWPEFAAAAEDVEIE